MIAGAIKSYWIWRLFVYEREWENENVCVRCTLAPNHHQVQLIAAGRRLISVVIKRILQQSFGLALWSCQTRHSYISNYQSNVIFLWECISYRPYWSVWLWQTELITAYWSVLCWYQILRISSMTADCSNAFKIDIFPTALCLKCIPWLLRSSFLFRSKFVLEFIICHEMWKVFFIR